MLLVPLTLWLVWRFDVFGFFIGIALILTSATALGAVTPYYCGRCGFRVASDAPSCSKCSSPFTESPKQRAHALGAGHDVGDDLIPADSDVEHRDHD